MPSDKRRAQIDDADLYTRGVATLLASWEEYARGSPDAGLHRFDGVVAAVFPAEPERGVYNNALLARGLGAGGRAAAVAAMEAAYAGAGIERFAAWVHESDEAMRAELSGRGYAIEESTRAMGLALEEASAPQSEIDLGPLAWSEYLGYLQPSAFHGGCSRAPTRMPFMSLARESLARTSPRRSPLTSMATAASTTCPRSRRRAAADWGPPLRHVTSTMP